MESDNQRDDRRSQGYTSEGTSVVSPVVNEIENCNSGYFFDGKSRRCIGDYFFISSNIFGFCVVISFNFVLKVIDLS